MQCVKFGVSLPKELVDAIDAEMREYLDTSRSATIRRLLVERLKEKGKL